MTNSIFNMNWHHKGCIYSWFYQTIDTDSKSTVMRCCSMLHHSILITIVKSNRREWKYLVYSVLTMAVNISTHTWHDINE